MAIDSSASFLRMAATKLSLLAALSSHARKPAALRNFLRGGRLSGPGPLNLPPRKKERAAQRRGKGFANGIKFGMNPVWLNA